MDELDYSDDPVTSMLDGIPIVGHIKALIYKIRGQRDLSVSAYIAATHNTFVSGFGVLGGYLAGITGSCVGGVIGGLFVDIPINLVTTRYNYVDLPRNWNMSKYSGFDLISLVAKDAFTGLLASVVCNGYMIPMLSLNDSENGNEKDYNTFIEETAGVVMIRMNFNTNTDGLTPCWVDNIPILGHINTLILYKQGNSKAVESFKSVTHRTGVMCFGVLGGYLTECLDGSVISGIIGGVLVDVAISAWTSSPYGYIAVLNLNEKRLFYLLLLALMDGVTAVLAVIGYTVFKNKMQSFFNKETRFEIHRFKLTEDAERDMSGSVHVIRIQKDMCGIIYMYLRRMEKETEKECYSDECEKVVVLKDTAYRDIITIPKLLIVDMPEAIQIPVNNISQLQPGDHIVYKRWRVLDFNVYDHHAIVGEVFLKKGKYTVYEQAPYSNQKEYRSRGKAWIKEIEKPFETNLIYKIDHREAAKPREDVRKTGHFICHHASPKVFGKKYNVVLNNCEHFANFCATGLRESQQVQKPTTTVIPVCLGFILSAITIATGTVDIVLFSLYLVFDFSVRAMVSHNNPLSILLRYIRGAFRPAQNAIEQ